MIPAQKHHDAGQWMAVQELAMVGDGPDCRSWLWQATVLTWDLAMVCGCPNVGTCEAGENLAGMDPDLLMMKSDCRKMKTVFDPEL